MRRGAVHVAAATLGLAAIVAAPVAHATSLFAAPVSYDSGFTAIAVALADITHQGPMHADILVLSSSPIGGGAYIFGNDPNYGIGPRAGVATGSGPASIAMADVNGDGNVDVVVANAGDNTVTITRGTGTYTFSIIRQAIAVGATPVAVAVADMNADGKLDLVVAEAGDSTVSVVPGNGDGTFGTRVSWKLVDVPCDLAVGRLRGTSRPDIVVRFAGRSGIEVLPNLGALAFGTPQFWPAGAEAATGQHSIALADVDGDGRLDVVLANAGTFSANTISVLRNRGGGQLASSSDFGARSGATALAVADFDGDGSLDVAAVCTADDVVDVLLGRGDGTFDAGTTYPCGHLPVAIAADDFIGEDGRIDLAIGTEDFYGPLSTLRNTGATPRLAVAPDAPAGALRLLAPRPNPAPGATSIALALGAAATVDVAVYDLAGREVRALARGAALAAGPHAFSWDRRDAAGAPAPGGVYVVLARAGAEVRSEKLVVIR